MKTIGSLALVALSLSLASVSFADNHQPQNAKPHNPYLNDHNHGESALSSPSGTVGSAAGSTLRQNTRRLNHGYMDVVNPGETFFSQLPSTTFDLALLREKQKYADNTLTLGGYIEADAQYWHANDTLAVGMTSSDLPKRGSGVYLTTVDLDAMSNWNDWVTGFIGTESANLGTATSSIEVKKAFVTFGNLKRNPFFISVGKSFLPFGTFYGGGVWSVPMTRAAFRPSEVPELLFGYYKNGLNTNLAFFNTAQSKQHDFVYSFFFTPKLGGNWKPTISASYIYDMRGAPSALGSAYKSAGVLSTNKRVPAIDVNGQIKFNQFDINAEYLEAFRQGTYNANATTAAQSVASRGETQGKPKAWELGADFNAPLLGKPMSYTLSYSRTYNMAGIPMGWSGQAIPGPSAFNGIKTGWIASMNRTITRNVYAGFEAQRGKTYANKTGYTYTLDLSVYF